MMTDRAGRKLSYANVMSTIAVFGILAGGGAYAANKIGPDGIKRNAVRSKHIMNRQVNRADIANNAVSSAQIQPGGVQAGDIASSALAFQSGDGTDTAASALTVPEDSQPDIFNIPGIGNVTMSCLSGGDNLVFGNDSGSTDQVWFDDVHNTVVGNSALFSPALSPSDRMRIMILDQGTVVAIDVAFFEQANGNCTYAASLQENSENAFP